MLIGAALGANGVKGMRKLTQRSLALLTLLGLLLGARAEALTAYEYQALRSTWRLGYVVGIAHGRKLYRDGGTDSREAKLDACIPRLSDIEIVDFVDAFLATNPADGERPAAEVVIEALRRHCMK